MTAVIERLYAGFAGYPLPRELVVCDQCGPEWSADDIRSTPLRSLSLQQLEALHVMSLGEDDFRHFFPRLIEALVEERSPVFTFNLGRLKGHVRTWRSSESTILAELVDDLWRRLLERHPAELGYFSDGPTLVDFTYWCDQPLLPFLDRWSATDTADAARHLGELVEQMFTMAQPVQPGVREEVLAWLRQPIIGERLRAAKLADAEELWTVCGRG